MHSCGEGFLGKVNLWVLFCRYCDEYGRLYWWAETSSVRSNVSVLYHTMQR